MRGKGLAHQVDGLLMPAGLLGERTEQVQGVRLPRHLAKDLAVGGLRLAQPAGLLMLVGDGEALFDGEHGHAL